MGTAAWALHIRAAAAPCCECLPPPPPPHPPPALSQRAANCPPPLLHREHANQVRQSKQRLLEQIQQVHRIQEWDRDRDQDPEVHCYGSEWPSQLPFYSPELDPRNHKPSGLRKDNNRLTFIWCLPENKKIFDERKHKLFFF